MRAKMIVGLLLTISPLDIGGQVATAPSTQGLGAVAGVPTFDAHVTPVDPSEEGLGVPFTSLAVTGEIDLAKVGIHPLATPRAAEELSAGPLGAAIGRGKAILALAPDVVYQNTANAFAMLLANFTPSETVNVYLNGALTGSFPADSDGRLFVSVSSGAGPGYVIFEAVGVTSGKRAGGVGQVVVSATFLGGGVAVAPHAINPTGSSTISLAATGYPPSAFVNVYRNGVIIVSATQTDFQGRLFLNLGVASHADTSAVYSVDLTTGGFARMIGATAEERSDAGAPPAGDQNAVRAFLDRAVLRNEGGVIGMSGEGFQPGEIVTVSGCAFGSGTANANGALAFFLNFGAGSGVGTCTLTGGTTGRAASASVFLHADGIPAAGSYSPGMIAAPASVGPGGDAVVLIDRLPINTQGSVYLDGLLLGNVSTNGSGYASFTVPKPSGGFVHEVGWIQSIGSNALATVLLLVNSSAYGDADSDGKTDRTVFRPSSGVWYTALSGGGATGTGWGVSSDVDVMGDFDGDGKADIAVFRPSTGIWYIVQSSNGAVRVVSWGTSGDIPLAGDVDGDGKDDLVIYRPSAGAWFFNKSGGGTSVLGWGLSTDQPLLGDFDGDGKRDAAIYRPTTGVWYVALSGGGTLIVGWGTAGDIPVAGDWDGDGKSDAAVFRPSTGQWLISKSSGGTLAVTWGTTGDVPVSGDWDGDGRSDFTVWRPSNGVWFTQFATGGTAVVGWGITGDKPSGRVPGS